MLVGAQRRGRGEDKRNNQNSSFSRRIGIRVFLGTDYNLQAQLTWPAVFINLQVKNFTNSGRNVSYEIKSRLTSKGGKH
jgi:hypothetical protein